MEEVNEDRRNKEDSSSDVQQATKSDSSGTRGDEEPGGIFECNICFESPEGPVVTPCGHLYCWPCILKWMEMHRSVDVCPVCKSGITRENLIPLYGRGTEKVDPRSKKCSEDLPPRPTPNRLPPQPSPYVQNPFNLFGGPGFHANIGGSDFHFTAGIGFFPSIFGLQFQAFNGNAAGTPPSPEQEQEIFLSRVALIVAILVLFATIFLN